MQRPDALAERNDDELMVLAASGRADAFALLVQRHMARLAGFAAKLAGDARLGEEIAQEVWLHIWAARARYHPDGRFVVYLYTCARNRCRNAARNLGRRARWDAPASNDAADRASSPTPDQLEQLLERERQRRTHEALMTLPLKLREPLILRLSEGLDYRDIAAVLGGSEASIRARVHRGLAQLRRQIERGS